MKRSFPKIRISPAVLLIVASALLSKNSHIERAIIIISAAFVHEVGHLIVALVCGIPIKCIRLDIFGAYIETDPLMCSYFKEAVLCLAGPLANILSAAAINIPPLPFDTRLFTVASVVFAFLNLLPAKGFDGGRALLCFLTVTVSQRFAATFLEVTSFFCVFMLWSASVYFIMRTGAYLSLFIFSGCLFSRLFLLPDSFSYSTKDK